MPKKVLTGADGNTWQKGQSGNPKGRPKKTLNKITDALAAEGYTRVANSEIAEFIQIILSLPLPKIQALVNDKENPAIARIVSAILGNASKDIKKFQLLLDIAYGKSQKIDITSNGETINSGAERQIVEAEVTLNFGLGAADLKK